MSRVTETTKGCARMRLAITGFFRDRTGVAAIEFAIILPMMLVMLFGTVEFSSALAVDRKVSLVARALANLTSQGTQATSTDLANYYVAGNKIMTPYAAPNMTITELYIDPSSGNARVQWSDGYAPHGLKQVITIPSTLIATNPSTGAINPNQYVILSEVNTTYTPLAIPLVSALMPASVTLSDVAYSIPRQSTCVFYLSTPSPANCPTQ